MKLFLFQMEVDNFPSGVQQSNSNHPGYFSSQRQTLDFQLQDVEVLPKPGRFNC